jgi:hypothetical protein
LVAHFLHVMRKYHSPGISRKEKIDMGDGPVLSRQFLNGIDGIWDSTMQVKEDTQNWQLISSRISVYDVGGKIPD